MRYRIAIAALALTGALAAPTLDILAPPQTSLAAQGTAAPVVLRFPEGYTGIRAGENRDSWLTQVVLGPTAAPATVRVGFVTGTGTTTHAYRVGHGGMIVDARSVVGDNRQVGFVVHAPRGEHVFVKEVRFNAAHHQIGRPMDIAPVAQPRTAWTFGPLPIPGKPYTAAPLVDVHHGQTFVSVMNNGNMAVVLKAAIYIRGRKSVPLDQPVLRAHSRMTLILGDIAREVGGATSADAFGLDGSGPFTAQVVRYVDAGVVHEANQTVYGAGHTLLSASGSPTHSVDPALAPIGPAKAAGSATRQAKQATARRIATARKTAAQATHSDAVKALIAIVVLLLVIGTIRLAVLRHRRRSASTPPATSVVSTAPTPISRLRRSRNRASRAGWLVRAIQTVRAHQLRSALEQYRRRLAELAASPTQLGDVYARDDMRPIVYHLQDKLAHIDALDVDPARAATVARRLETLVHGDGRAPGLDRRVANTPGEPGDRARGIVDLTKRLAAGLPHGSGLRLSAADAQALTNEIVDQLDDQYVGRSAVAP